MKLNAMKDAIVRVGDGRGFIMEARFGRIVVTAAHCLPELPPPHPGAYTSECTYRSLIGPRDGVATVAALCVFVDPIADVAVLCQPDNQSHGDDADAYEAFTDVRRPAFRLAAPARPLAVSLLTLDDRWVSAVVPAQLFESLYPERHLRIEAEDDAAYQGGTSGSPVVDGSGAAIALVSCGDMLNPSLTASLPGWLLKELEGK